MECLYCIKPRHVVRKFHSHSGKSKYMQQASLLILMFMFFLSAPSLPSKPCAKGDSGNKLNANTAETEANKRDDV